ncbi:MAG TPA: DUF262 domain-containing protein, partial [Solirubrobacteraceae bacterium]|nr:DUF262 domain-containing protein [Solirubrobacteraceae bacterium]
MIYQSEIWKLDQAVQAWSDRQLWVNQEYQRGPSWSERQRQLLIDSLLRSYPLPRFYARKKVTEGLGGTTENFEVIDGQQRIDAMARYLDNDFALLDPSDRRVALPRSIREAPCPWAGKTFSELGSELKERLQNVELAVVVVDKHATDEEVRDLFIRLQAGTALTRQQVRDALPGAISEYVITLAGKGGRERQRRPRFPVFSAVDQRGGGADDGDGNDNYHADRQTCAQLLCIYMRLRATWTIVGPRSPQIDDLYHEYTGFDPNGGDADEFEHVLEQCTRVFGMRPRQSNGRQIKVRKIRLFSLFLCLFCLNRANVPVGQFILSIGETYWKLPTDDEPRGRPLEAGSIAEHFAWVDQELGARLDLPKLDRRRLFSEQEKQEIRERDAGICQICAEAVEIDDQEYDHIRPWALG